MYGRIDTNATKYPNRKRRYQTYFKVSAIHLYETINNMENQNLYVVQPLSTLCMLGNVS